MTKKKQKYYSFSSKIEGYIQASRIEGGVIGVIFFLLGEWYYLKDFLYFETLLSILSIFFIINSGSWLNYVFDKDLDKFAKKDIDFFKVISPKEMFLTSVLISSVSLVVLFYISFFSFLLGLLTFFIFFIYAAPPFRFKTIPPFDVVCNFLGFGFLPFVLGFTFSDFFLDFSLVIKGTIISLPVISYYLFINIFDIESDRKYGIKNSTVLLGFKVTKILAISMFLISLISSLFFFSLESVFPISLLISCPLVLVVFFVKEINFLRRLISALFLIWTGLITFLLFIFSLSLIPLVFLIITFILAMMTIYTYVKISSNFTN